MVTSRPLKLKAQVGAPGKKDVAKVLPIARIWVDSGVYHLDAPFDYWVPAEYSDLVQVGVRVEVGFGSTRREGIVVERSESSPNVGGLKQILKVISAKPIATTQSLELFRLTARRWAASPLDLVRSAVPPRVASVDKEDFSRIEPRPSIDVGILGEIPKALSQRHLRAYWALPPVLSRQRLLALLILARSKGGDVLLVVPDERELAAVEDQLRTLTTENIWVRLDGHISRSDRYRNFLKFTQGKVHIALGLRGSIFTPLGENSTIIVSGESSEHLYEARTPGWNARDIALLRSSEFHTNLILVGYSPSLEVARLLETKWLAHVAARANRHVTAIAQAMGELIPDGAFPIIRKALKAGPVLFLVPRKGYGNAVLCRKCRNIAVCDCGGRLEVRSANAAPRCVLCHTNFDPWRCSWCQSSEIYLASRGIDRFSEEIGRAFPNIEVINSSGEHIVDEVQSRSALVIATPGAQPRVSGGYSAVALLEGVRFFAHTALRSNESAREVFFQSAALASESGTTFLALAPTHPMVAALTRWNTSSPARMELLEREKLHFPPYYRFVCIDVSAEEAGRLHAGITRSREEGRLGVEVHISGMQEGAKGQVRITLSAPVATAAAMVDFVHELQRRRSVAGKALLGIRVDPYSLT